MSIYKNTIRDTRIQEYLPVRHVMLAGNVHCSEILSDNPSIQLSLKYRTFL